MPDRPADSWPSERPPARQSSHPPSGPTPIARWSSRPPPDIEDREAPADGWSALAQSELSLDSEEDLEGPSTRRHPFSMPEMPPYEASDPVSGSQVVPPPVPELVFEPAALAPDAAPDPRTAGGGRAVRAERVIARVDAVHSSMPEPLPPDRTQRLQALVTELASCGPELDEPVRRRLVSAGPAALPILTRAFPGAVWVDLSRPHRPLRSARKLSGIGAAFVDFGEAAVPHVAQLLRDPRSSVRMAACVVATDLAHPTLVRPLAARLHDPRTLIRNAAMVALRSCTGLPAYRELRHELMGGLGDTGSPIEWRRRAAWTLGQLRDGAGVVALIEGLAAEPQVEQECRASLIRVVGVDLGGFRFRWRRWWKKNQKRERALWLLDALDQPDDAMRAQVAEELVLWTGEGFDRRHATATREQARELATFFRSVLGVAAGR